MSISPALVRFGVFELDLNTRELLKTGRRLKLQEQSFRVLRLLLEQPGQVVTRERMKEALWPSDTFVDFDHSLNAAIAKLRQALGDSAETPRFVETVARRGYRFIAPVDTVPSSAPNGAGTDAAAKETAAVPNESKQTARGKTILTRIGAAGLVTLGVVGLIVALRWLRTPENPNSAVLHRITFDAGLTMDPTVSRDGSLLAYSSDKGSDGPLNLWVQQLRGSGPIRVTHSNADDHAPSFSPDGAQLVFRSEREPRGIYVVPSFGGAARLLVADGQGPRFSPDGKWIAYWSSEGRNGGHVYILPSGGGTPKQISAALAWAGLALIWSPTSKYVLAYGGAQRQPHFQEHPDWWVIPIDGGRPIRTGAQRVFEQQGFKLNIFDTPPYPTDWIGNEILFSAKRGDTSDLWRVPIHSGTWQITGAGKRLTSVTGEIVAASIRSGGEVVFANISTQIHLWSLPVKANRGTFSGGPAQLTESASSEYWPSVSGDGRRVVFTSVRTGRESTWLKDLVSGAESQLPIIGKLDEFPKLSPDGKRVAFTVMPEGRDGKPTIQILSLETMSTQEVLQDGDWVWTWSPDSRYLLCKAGALRYIRIVAVNSGRSVDILRDSAHNMYQASFSGDGRWLTFQHDSGLFVARYKGPVSIPKADWIRITDGSHFDDKPRFSPDGNRLYFTSDRDGFWCLWTQRLDRETKQPVDQPMPVHHMHFGRRSLSNVGAPLADIAITQDRIIFPQRELTGNIWMLSSDSAN